MPTSAIGASLIQPTSPGLPALPGIQDGSGAPGVDFGDTLRQAIAGLDASSNQVDASALNLAVGGDVDVHEVMLNLEQASINFQTALQVRNKLVDAYQEIMRMSI